MTKYFLNLISNISVPILFRPSDFDHFFFKQHESCAGVYRSFFYFILLKIHLDTNDNSIKYVVRCKIFLLFRTIL